MKWLSTFSSGAWKVGQRRLASPKHDPKHLYIFSPDPRNRELVTPAVLVKIASSQKAFLASTVRNLQDDPTFLCE